MKTHHEEAKKFRDDSVEIQPLVLLLFPPPHSFQKSFPDSTAVTLMTPSTSQTTYYLTKLCQNNKKDWAGVHHLEIFLIHAQYSNSFPKGKHFVINW